MAECMGQKDWGLVFRIDKDERDFIRRWAELNGLTVEEAAEDILERGMIEQRSDVGEGGG